MDPNLIHLDWERTFEALTIVVILAFIVERALAIVYENELYLKYVDRPGLKEAGAAAVAIAACWVWKFDAVGMVLLTETTTVPGYVITGAVVAGGSKASLHLFREVLHIRSTAYEQRHELKAERALEQARSAADRAETAGSEAERSRLAVASRRHADEAKRLAQRNDRAGPLAEAAEACAHRAEAATGDGSKKASERKRSTGS